MPRAQSGRGQAVGFDMRIASRRDHQVGAELNSLPEFDAASIQHIRKLSVCLHELSCTQRVRAANQGHGGVAGNPAVRNTRSGQVPTDALSDNSLPGLGDHGQENILCGHPHGDVLVRVNWRQHAPLPYWASESSISRSVGSSPKHWISLELCAAILFRKTDNYPRRTRFPLDNCVYNCSCFQRVIGIRRAASRSERLAAAVDCITRSVTTL